MRIDFAKSNQNQKLSTMFAKNEKEEKRVCNQRVIQVEHGSFTPLVFSAHGGCGNQTQHFIRTLTEKIAAKRDMSSSSLIANYVRKKISFSLIKSLVNCVRGNTITKCPNRHQHRRNYRSIARLVCLKLEVRFFITFLRFYIVNTISH